MNKIICGIYDKVAKEYIVVFMTQNEETACRQFVQDLKNPRSPLAMYPNDYEIHKICDLNGTTGETKSEVVVLQYNSFAISSEHSAEAPKAE